MNKVGFIGLGNMGGPMAANLARAGYDVCGFDISARAVQALAASGGRAGSSPADAAQGAIAVITMLPAGEHVRAVWVDGGLIGALAGTQALLIDCSTIDVDTARYVTAAAQKAGLEMLDAPVSGGVSGAQAGTLTFMVGGTDSAFARGQPILQAMGRNVVHAGAAGAGQAAKICNNMMLGISMIAVSEGFLLGTRLGLDLDKLFAICSSASSACWAMTSYCPAPGPVPAAPSNRDYEPGFAASLMLKDLLLAQTAAKSAHAPTPLGELATELYRRMVEAGEGGRDFSVAYRWLQHQSR
ncbi:MAG: 3-hydroxyisobutyrate dehydrogenase [Acetobacteraceae bacterium]|nr:3-hydroxyisobutyrate dehydrogenase [Acetobacteraceae bacterium]MBV8590042.1 3-hydroxyisobutyrate dehydrogenase [Acetobacteraceae bacterium]